LVQGTKSIKEESVEQIIYLFHTLFF